MRVRAGVLAVYEWRAWDGFLVSALWPRAVRLPAVLGENADEVNSRVPAGVSQFMFHVNLTNTSDVPFDRRALIEFLDARGVSVMNGALVDVSKRRVQRASA